MCNDPNIAYESFMLMFTSMQEKHTTERNFKNRRKKLIPRKPWITKGIMTSIIKKQKLYHRSINVPTDRNVLLYKRYRNKLNNIIRLRKQDYFTCLIEQNKNDMCKTWKIVNEIMGRQNISKLPQFIQKGHNKINDEKLIANIFNSYFACIGSSISKKVKKSTKTFTDYLGHDTMESIFFLPTNEHEIIQVVKQLRNTSSAGHDGISVSFLKEIIYAIAKPLSFIFNLSLTTGIVPEPLKLAKVIPVHKKGDKHTVENYRPISLLPTFSKILERVIYNRLYEHLLKNKILAKEQFGFRPLHSTELALLHTLEQILTSLDNKETVMALYIDLSKAFDSLDHTIMLHKLEHYGVRGIPLNWFKNYLTDRKQYTSFNGSNSNILPLTCGVPQGSILGPLLFLIYVNDIINTSSLLRFVLYADDTNILFSHSNETTLYNVVNSELIYVCDWFKANKLQMNADKTKYMIFRSSKKCKPSHLNLVIDNDAIKQVDNTNFLGVIIDDKLTWTKHVNIIHGKISMTIGIMRKLRSVLPLDTLFMLYNAFVLPHLNYCSLVWSGTSLNNLQRLNVLQKKAIRLCSNAHYLAHSTPLFKDLYTLTIFDHLSLKTGLFMYKYFNALLPVVFDNCFKLNSAIHKFDTRNKHDIVLPYCRLSMKQNNSIIFKGAKFWNALNPMFKKVNTQNTFKSKYKFYLINAYK